MSREVRMMAESSGHLNMCSTKRVEAAMRTCERDEMSEKVSVCETGMPYAEFGERISR